MPHTKTHDEYVADKSRTLASREKQINRVFQRGPQKRTAPRRGAYMRAIRADVAARKGR